MSGRKRRASALRNHAKSMLNSLVKSFALRLGSIRPRCVTRSTSPSAGYSSANGFLPPVDWTTAHENDQDCAALLRIVKGKFKPVYGKPGKPFVCFADDLAKIPKKPELA